MAVKPLGDTTGPDQVNKEISVRPSSVAETIQVYHEDVPRTTTFKDAKFREVYHQRSLADTLTFSQENNMYPFPKVYECEQTADPHRWVPVLDPGFLFSFDPKLGESTSQVVAFGHDSTEALLETYCSSGSSFSTVSPRQSLLPPLPHDPSKSTRALLTGQSPDPPQGALPVTPLCERSARSPAFGSPSKRSITSLELEQLSQTLLPAKLHRNRTPSPESAATLKCARPTIPSLSSASTSPTSPIPCSTMSSFSYSEIASPSTTAGSSFSAPINDGSITRRRRKGRKPENIVWPECIASTVQGRSISFPLKTKSTSPIGTDFDLGLPSHDFETRRRSPTPLTTDAIISTPMLVSACTTSSGTPTSPSSLQPLLSPLQERSAEVSAFDSDTDGERPSQTGILRNKFSRPRLKSAKTGTEAVPTVKARIVSKGASLPKRISKQDIKTPGLRFSNTSENDARHGITMTGTSPSSTTSPAASRTPGATSPPVTLRRTLSTRASLPPKAKRTSNASRASKRSGIAFKNMPSVASANELDGKRKISPGKKLRSWFARAFGRKKMH